MCDLRPVGQPGCIGSAERRVLGFRRVREPRIVGIGIRIAVAVAVAGGVGQPEFVGAGRPVCATAVAVTRQFGLTGRRPVAGRQPERIRAEPGGPFPGRPHVTRGVATSTCGWPRAGTDCASPKYGL